MKEPSISSAQLASEVSSRTEEEVLPRTIRRHLQFNGLKYYCAIKKPLLTRKMKSKRLEWCQQYKDMPLSFWQSMLYSDETMVTINYSTVMNKIRRFPWQNPLLPKFLNKRMKFPQKVMFWGSFSSKCVGSLLPISGIMNSQKYIELLNSSLSKDMAKTGTRIFQDDSAPCHRAKSVHNWFIENKIETLDWPGNSPDLNPIEHLWATVKRKLRTKPIYSTIELKKQVLLAWNQIPGQDLENLVNSIPSRINAVIKSYGGSTKY